MLQKDISTTNLYDHFAKPEPNFAILLQNILLYNNHIAQR